MWIALVSLHSRWIWLSMYKRIAHKNEFILFFFQDLKAVGYSTNFPCESTPGSLDIFLVAEITFWCVTFFVQAPMCKAKDLLHRGMPLRWRGWTMRQHRPLRPHRGEGGLRIVSVARERGTSLRWCRWCCLATLSRHLQPLDALPKKRGRTAVRLRSAATGTSRPRRLRRPQDSSGPTTSHFRPHRLQRGRGRGCGEQMWPPPPQPPHALSLRDYPRGPSSPMWVAGAGPRCRSHAGDSVALITIYDPASMRATRLDLIFRSRRFTCFSYSIFRVIRP